MRHCFINCGNDDDDDKTRWWWVNVLLTYIFGHLYLKQHAVNWNATDLPQDRLIRQNASLNSTRNSRAKMNIYRLNKSTNNLFSADAVLNGHVLSVYKVFSEMECLQRCLSCGQCMSFNFERQISESRHDCELNAMTTALSGDALESRVGFSYYEPIKVTLPQEVSSNIMKEQIDKIRTHSL